MINLDFDSLFSENNFSSRFFRFLYFSSFGSSLKTLGSTSFFLDEFILGEDFKQKKTNDIIRITRAVYKNSICPQEFNEKFFK